MSNKHTHIMKTKVTKVTEIEFSRTKEGDYDYSFNASQTVKVNNLAKDIYFNYNKDKDEATMKTQNFDVLKEAGIELDFLHLLAEYKSAALKAVEEQKVNRVNKIKENYKTSWLHNFGGFELPEGVTIERITEEAYVEQSLRSFGSVSGEITIKYKGRSEMVDYCDVARDRFSHNFKYQISSSLTDYKKKNYSKSEKLVKKFVELVDASDRETKRAVTEKLQKDNEIELKTAHLTETFGIEVTHEKEWRRGYSQRDRGYYVDRYTVKKGERSISVSVDYLNNEKYETSYSIGSFNKLTAEKAQAIFNIL